MVVTILYLTGKDVSSKIINIVIWVTIDGVAGNNCITELTSGFHLPEFKGKVTDKRRYFQPLSLKASICSAAAILKSDVLLLYASR